MATFGRGLSNRPYSGYSWLRKKYRGTARDLARVQFRGTYDKDNTDCRLESDFAGWGFLFPVTISTNGPTPLLARYSYNDGTPNDKYSQYNPTSYNATISGGVANFNGAIGGSIISFQPDSFGLFGKSRSYSFWFKTSVAGGVIHCLQLAAGGSVIPEICLNSSGQLYFNVWSGAQSSIGSTTAYNDNQWHHGVACYDFDTTSGHCLRTLYVDGGLAASDDLTTIQDSNTRYDSSFIGYGAGSASGWTQANGDYWNGSIDDFRLYKGVLKLADVQVLYAAGRDPDNSNMFASFVKSAGKNINYNIGGYLARYRFTDGTRFDPTLVGPGANLSYDGLTLTCTSSQNNTEYVLGVHDGGGKYYFELTAGTCANSIWGLAGGGVKSLSNYLGQTDYGIGMYNSGWLQGSGDANSPPQVSGHTYGFAMDLDNNKLWVKDWTAGGSWNNMGGSSDPSTGAGGHVFATNVQTGGVFVAATVRQSGDSCSFNFGATSYTGTPPTGFGNWNYPIDYFQTYFPTASKPLISGGTAQYFGSGYYTTFATDFGLASTGGTIKDRTFSLWFNATTAGGGLLSQDGSGYVPVISMDSTGTIWMNSFVQGSGGSSLSSSTSGLNDGNWHLATVTTSFSGSGVATRTIYIDGQQKNSDTITGFTFQENFWTTTYLGFTNLSGWESVTNSTSWYTGYLDDVRIYNRVLSSNEVSALYSAGRDPSAITGTQTFWSKAVGKIVSFVKATTTIISATFISGSSGTTFNKTVTVVSTTATTFVKQVGKIVSFSAGATSTSFLKQVGKTFLVTGQNSGAKTTTTYTKQAGKIVSVASTTTTTFPPKTINKIALIASTTTSTFIKAVTKAAIAITSVSTSTFIKSAGKLIPTITSVSTTSFLKSAGKIVSVASTTASTFKRAVGKIAAITSTSVSTFVKAVAKSVPITSSGAVTAIKAVTKAPISILSTSTTSFLKSVGKIVSVASTSTTTTVRNIIRALTVTVPSVTSTTFLKSVGKTASIASTSSSSFLKSAGKIVSVVSTTTSTFKRAVSKTVAIASTSTTSFIKSVGKIVSVASTSATSVVYGLARLLTVNVTSTTTTTVSKSVGKIVSIASTTTSTFLKSVGKIASIASTSAVSYLKSVGKIASIASTGTVSTIKQVGKKLAITSSSVTSIITSAARTFFQTVSAASATATSVLKQVGKTASIASTSTTTTKKSVGKIAAITSTTMTSVSKGVAKLVSVASTSTTSFAKAVGKRVAVLSSSLTTITTLVTKTYFQTINAVSATSTTVLKQAGKFVKPVSTTATTLTKSAGKVVLAPLTGSVSLARAIGFHLNVLATSTVQAIKRVAHSIAVASTTSTSWSANRIVQVLVTALAHTTTSVLGTFIQNVGNLIKKIVVSMSWPHIQTIFGMPKANVDVGIATIKAHTALSVPRVEVSITTSEIATDITHN